MNLRGNMRFRKKPVIIDAIQYTGINVKETISFTNETAKKTMSDNIIILTLEGDLIAKPGDWIIRGVKGEFYPCRADIFNLTYEKMLCATETRAATVPIGTLRSGIAQA